MSTPIAPFRLQPPADLLERQPQLRRQSAELAQRYASGQMVDETMLQRLGQALWQALGQDDALAQARQAAGVQPLPLIISSSDAASQQLPWETLYHPTYGFLARADGFTLSRANPALTPTLPPLESGPLRVLLFTTLPDDLDGVKGRLDVEEEQAQVLAALNPWIVEGLVELTMPDDGRLSTLQALLKREQPHLLFLSGHGNFHPGVAGGAPAATFLFEGETAGSHAVSEQELAHALLGSKLGCVVLSACESGMGASDALTHGLSWRLSSIGIPQVIGMREAILDRAGTLFARAFCDAVARRRTVAEALQAGRQAITTPLKAMPGLADAAPGLAERSLGQWALPMLISHDPTHPLIDWRFTPRPQAKIQPAQTLQTIYLPPRFIGRRRELRDRQRQLRQGTLQQLLITGPGGQGKTALAGKLAQDLERQGYLVLAWSARPENDWAIFQLELMLHLSTENRERYEWAVQKLPTEEARAALLLRLLLQQARGRLALFFDNLESLQDPVTQALTDERIVAWIKAAQSLTNQGLLLLLTSRWRLPGWPAADHLSLEHASYGDFLQMARRQLPPALLRDDHRLRTLYTTLHGNGRGLTFFAAALQGLTPAAEADFLARLAQATAETQNDMALAQIVSHLPDPSRQLLARLPAYHTPVPLEGIVKLAGELPDPPALLQRLLAVSLVEPSFAPDLECDEYQLSPLVADWLARQGVPLPALALLQTAAAYQHYLFRHERPTLPQAITTHAARRRAQQIDQADRLALDWIVGPLNRDGLYHTLLTDWLPPICQSPDPQTRGEALNQTGKQLHHIGQYTDALRYLEQSLTILQQIGDKAGKGTTLNNIAQIFKARGDYDTALRYLEQSLTILQQIGDKGGEGTTLNNIATTAYAQGDYDTALRYLQQSLQIQQDIGDKQGEGATRSNISLIFKARGDYDTALHYLEQSLKIRQDIGDRSGEGTTLNNMATTAYARGDYETALRYLQQSLQIQQDISDRRGEGNSLSNISQIFQARGDYDTALHYLEQSLTISQEIGDRSGEGTTLNNMATTAYARGDYDAALRYLQQSLQISQDIGGRSGEGTTLNNISQIFQARGDYDTALHYLQQSLQIQQDIGDRRGEGNTLNNMATTAYARGDYDTALRYLQQSLQIQQDIDDVAGLCATLFNMGHIFLQNGQQQEAMIAWVTVYRLAKPMGLAQVLQALEKLAGSLGLPGGLQEWE